MNADAKAAATFVFKGTVVRIKAANLRAVTETDRTVVVKVDEVVRAPEALAEFVGQEITVRLADGERVQADQKAVFHTNGWIFGEALAVQSVGHDAIRKGAAVQRAAGAGHPAHAAAQQQISTRASAAPVVLSGRVVAVGLPAGGPSPRISEHEPLWREAVVEVDKVHKGATTNKRVVVRFPASTDVRWHRATKFRVGNEGVFILQPDQTSGHARTVGLAAAGFTPGETYTCLHSTDFNPSDQPDAVAAAITAATAGQANG
jgi:hypothetical protein